MQALSKKKTGDICTIKWMFGIPDVLDFLRSRKIKEGSTVQVIQRINGGDRKSTRLTSSHIMLSRMPSSA